jgi:hypothetical protein
VTRKDIPVHAQWALHGKVLDDEGYRVIACSQGDLSRANFADALGRFTLGALDTLPQVSVSYLQPATRSPGGGYLALAVHWFAADGQRYADGVMRFDNQGRHTAFTSYFCAPYAQLATQGITYLDMYKAFSAVTLPAKDGPPKDMTITAAAQQVPAIDGLAMRVAPLLLTGVPVCVLGADETSMDERLRFIDTVMGLLPYGFRAKMTAATWTRATNRNHRFRLFFSSAPRASDKPDHLVPWGEPELVRVPGGDAGHYYGWLDDKVTPLANLALLQHEAGLSDSADTEALRLVDEIRLWRRPRLRPMPPGSPASPASADKREAPASKPAAAAGTDPVERLLRECDEHVRGLNLARLRQDLNLLQHQVESGGIDDGHRRRYRSLITRLDLLRPNFRLGKFEGRLYETLIALAFGAPVTYEALCQVEDALRKPPDVPLYQPLLEAVERAGAADPRVKAIVYASQDARKLAKWLSSREVDAFGLISQLARGAWHRKEHGRLFCDATLQYLQEKQGRYSTAEIRRVLSRNGYLAQALREVGHDQYQVHALTLLLVAAFPKDQYPLGLDRATVVEILARTQDAPTPALLAAILRRVPAADVPLVWDAYVYGSVARMDLNEATHGALWALLPAVGAAQAPELDPQAGQDTEQTAELPPWLGLGAPPGRERGTWPAPGIAEET